MVKKKLLVILLFCLIIVGVCFAIRYSLQNKKPNNKNPYTLSSHNRQTIASNQWYSSIYKVFPTQPLFAFPLAYRITEDGVVFSKPRITKTPDTIFASFIPDFSVGLDQKLMKPTIQNIGDWSVSLRMENNNKQNLSYTLAQGVPFTVVHTNASYITMRMPDTYSIYNNGKEKIENTKNLKTQTFRLDIHDNSYIIVLDQERLVTLTSHTITIPSERIFIGVLDKKENFDLFEKNSQAEITTTTATWDIQDKTLKTHYTFSGNQKTPLIALLPHQTEGLLEKPTVLGTYESLRGKLQLIKTNSFTTSMPIVIPETNYASLGQSHPDFVTAVQKDTKEILADNQPTNGDYFLGTWYGKATNLLLLTQTASLSSQNQALLHYLEPRLLESLQHFRYQKDKQSVIADKPEFGNEQLNDHHFHYGYYIRAAAFLALQDPSYTNKVKNQVNLLVSDIATTDRNATTYPFIRNFNIYEGHSMADGFANFGDGNNQESSSEAIHAWYSLYLWSKVTNDKQLENTALYLYNTEIQSTRYYWFGKNGEYTSPYNHPMASLVWGGKVDFSTWFSGKTNMKYGIQILPFTPGSFGYLGSLTDFGPYQKDYDITGGNITDDWGDLFVMLESFYNPQKALTQKDSVQKFEARNLKSLFLYVLYRNGKK